VFKCGRAERKHKQICGKKMDIREALRANTRRSLTNRIQLDIVCDELALGTPARDGLGLGANAARDFENASAGRVNRIMMNQFADRGCLILQALSLSRRIAMDIRVCGSNGHDRLMQIPQKARQARASVLHGLTRQR
jgi:hypothetical protein